MSNVIAVPIDCLVTLIYISQSNKHTIYRVWCDGTTSVPEEYVSAEYARKVFEMLCEQYLG